MAPQATCGPAAQSTTPRPAEAEILGVFPHMHALGRSLSLHASGAAPGGDETCLASVPRWDYTWQELAFYRQSLRFAADPQLTLECEHSTLGVEHAVTWGERLEDEMCMAFLAVGN